MTKKITLVLFVLLLFFFKNFAQTNSVWEKIHLNSAGYNIVAGVEALYSLTKCNNDDVVFIKFINHNDYAVQVEWYNAVFTQDLKWIKKENLTDKKTLTLNANTEMQGDCSDTNTISLKIPLKDFVNDKTAFKRFSTSNLEISKK